MNLVLRSTEKMFYMHSPFDSEDLLEVNADSSLLFSLLLNYFCYFLLLQPGIFSANRTWTSQMYPVKYIESFSNKFGCCSSSLLTL